MTTAPAAQVQPQSDGLSGAEAGLLALLAAGGLAGAGFMVARSRRKRNEDEIVEAEPSADRVTADRAAVARAPVVTTEPVAVAARQPERAFRQEPATERFIMPAGQVPAGAEGEELLRQMVAAPPDEANPFTSLKARRKRARLILQHQARLHETQGETPFDWRTYRSSPADARVDEPA